MVNCWSHWPFNNTLPTASGQGDKTKQNLFRNKNVCCLQWYRCSPDGQRCHIHLELGLPLHSTLPHHCINHHITPSIATSLYQLPLHSTLPHHSINHHFTASITTSLHQSLLHSINHHFTPLITNPLITTPLHSASPSRCSANTSSSHSCSPEQPDSYSESSHPSGRT